MTNAAATICAEVQIKGIQEAMAAMDTAEAEATALRQKENAESLLPFFSPLCQSAENRDKIVSNFNSLNQWSWFATNSVGIVLHLASLHKHRPPS